MSDIYARAKAFLKQEVGLVQETILEEFRRRTPGYEGSHQIGEEAVDHEHFSYGSLGGQTPTEGYAEKLVNSWEFIDNPMDAKSVGAVVNTHPAAALVEYGYFKNGRHVHEGGHRMIASAIKAGGVTQLYAIAAQKTLIAVLNTSDLKARAKLTRDVRGGVLKKKDGMNIYWRKGRIHVKGAVGRGFTSEGITRLTNKFADAVVESLNP